MTSVRDLQEGVANLKLGANESGKPPATGAAEQLSADLQLFLEHPNLRAALSDGSLNLANFSTEIADELEKLETDCIDLYRTHAKDIDQMESDLSTVQTVLAQLKEMLLGFQADLGGLSGDIRELQEKSRTLDVQLRNRRGALGYLDEFLGHIVLSPSLAMALTDGPVNHANFVQAVRELRDTYESVHVTQAPAWAQHQVPSQTVAGEQVQQQVDQLCKLAVSRTREYFLAQMVLLKRPQTNVRLIQVHGLRQYEPLYDFLRVSAPAIADEIFVVYRESMAATIAKLFALYQQQLAAMDNNTATRHDVLAMDDAHTRDVITTKVKQRTDLFCLGSRASNVSGVQTPIVVAAVPPGQRFPYERLLDSLLGHLVLTVKNEHMFGRQFFRQDVKVFGPTLSILLEGLENYLFDCHDGIAILLMIQVVHKYKRDLHQVPVHTLDDFLRTMTQLLWPRLKLVMDAHYRSVQQATPQKLSVDSKSRNAHVVSRRFAEFTCSLWLVLHNVPEKPAMVSRNRSASKHERQSSNNSKTPTSPGSPLPSNISMDSANSTSATAGDKLLQDLDDLVNAYLQLLARLTEQHTETNKLVFFINNIDACVLIFQERKVTTGGIFQRLVERLMQQRELFVEQELLPGFSNMIAFTSQSESQLAAGDPATALQSSASVMEALILDFAGNWKTHISTINSNVLSYFANFRNGMEILKQVLTQLLLYYTRFQDVLRKAFQGKPPANLTKNLVPTNIILAEIKKYALAI